jgi:hypothetical protein
MTPGHCRRLRAWAVVIALGIGFVPGLSAQEPSPSTRRLNVSCIVVPPPKIDGLIDDACWTGVQPVSGFYQYDPVNGARASEETPVWAAFDQDNLYFASS